jgi:hypothetical protein
MGQFSKRILKMLTQPILGIFCHIEHRDISMSLSANTYSEVYGGQQYRQTVRDKGHTFWHGGN